MRDRKDNRSRKLRRGLPQGSRHKATIAAQALLDGEGEALTRKCVEMALDGDTTALRLCLERLCPPRKDSPVKITLPKVETSADLSQASGAILEAVAKGELTPGEGQALAGLVEAHRRAVETTELEARITALEKENKK
ncbi:MAG: hypothetical protein HQK81_09755 [Desulfovibrionaceae bacterium]|nr:hypothetical protein [Desulfovibrionaceae bacterium]MBF0514323.1 hypothetical protein [Desulfovibrionaceae bacterium]